jgi:subtilisin family serine protease
MYNYQIGGRKGKVYALHIAPDYLVVRVNKDASGQRAAHLLPSLANENLKQYYEIAEKGVAMFQVIGSDPLATRNEQKQRLSLDPNIAFAGRVLQNQETREPLIYTENIFVQFSARAKKADITDCFKAYGLSVKTVLKFAEGAYLVSAKEGSGTAVFDMAHGLLQEKIVKLCHPELLWQRHDKAIHAAQWHLKETTISGRNITAHAHVSNAHKISTGKGVCIAVIDDGVQVSHQEFSAFGKLQHPYNFVKNSTDANPKSADSHGTNCAGVACASGIEASGVAPDAFLMPIVMPSTIGSVGESLAIEWAASHGADVISCSWGPPDGPYWDVKHPKHQVVFPLPDHTRLAIEYASTKGRNGKGCVITWAAGNGAEPVENDGYASHPAVMAIAACNERSERSIYSDYGKYIACCFPSGDYQAPGKPPLTTKGLYVADLKGMSGESSGDYTDHFTGTSAACPGVAGVAALVLQICPHWSATQVRAALLHTCDKIDIANGKYDAAGHSHFYGYGRVNAEAALRFAQAQSAKKIDVKIKHIVVKPAKGLKEQVELVNQSSFLLNEQLLFRIGKRTELVLALAKPLETFVITLKKLKLPNKLGTLTIETVDGQVLTLVTWKQAELDHEGRKKFI